MIVCMQGVLTARELDALRHEAQRLPFVPGTETAGTRARRVKRTEQISQNTSERKVLHDIVMGALGRSRDFKRAVLPSRIRPPVFLRYREGMSYGNHVDSPLMGPILARDRSDVSLTLFISDIDDYDGGELVMNDAFGSHKVKLAAGSAVAYPSTSLHQVTPVTRGERLVAVTWVQSYVRDERQRQILWNLSKVKDRMNSVDVDAEETDLLHHAYANLVRMWAET